jgi:hypothetical protein
LLVVSMRLGIFRARARGIGDPGVVERETAEVRNTQDAQSHNGRDDRQLDRGEAAPIACEALEG